VGGGQVLTRGAGAVVILFGSAAGITGAAAACSSRPTPSQATASGGRWPRSTAPTWPSACPARTWAAPSAPARSAWWPTRARRPTRSCCTRASPGGRHRGVGGRLRRGGDRGGLQPVRGPGLPGHRRPGEDVGAVGAAGAINVRYAPAGSATAAVGSSFRAAAGSAASPSRSTSSAPRSVRRLPPGGRPRWGREPRGRPPRRPPRAAARPRSRGRPGARTPPRAAA
jgi:hypothetical protein